MRSHRLRFLRNVTVVTIIVIASGCAAVHHFSDTTERENAAANFRARWLGKSEADVTRRYGAPADTTSAPSGHRVLTYRNPGTAATGTAGASARDTAQPRPDARSCELQFEIDNATSVVVRAVLTGNDCRGDI